METGPTELSSAERGVERRIADRLARLRSERAWSLDDLAQRTGISRASLSRLERSELSPTAAMLGKLCTVYGWTLSRLMADAEARTATLVPAAEQPQWTDPDSGYRRRAVSPPAPGLRGEVVEVRLPAGACVSYDASPVAGLEHHLWMLEGNISLEVEGSQFRLGPGDCLRYVLTGSSRFQGTGRREARYVIAIRAPMSEPLPTIEEWRPDLAATAAVAADLDTLSAVLHAVVHDGAGVSFVVPFSLAEARAFWLDRVLPGVRARTRRVVVARWQARIVGTVQLDLAMPPNQPHRGEVAKLLVHPAARRRGLARQLMLALEAIARAERRTLLTLDTASQAAEGLYRSLGYAVVGVIPRYARGSLTAELEPTTIMYKDLVSEPPADPRWRS